LIVIDNFILVVLAAYLGFSQFAGHNMTEIFSESLEADYVRHSINSSVIMFSFAVFNLLVFLYGLFYDNLYELYAAIGAKFLSSGFAIYRFVNGIMGDWDHLEMWFDITLAVFVLFFQILYFFFLYPLYKDYRWRIHKKVGYDEEFKKIHKYYLIFLTLLKFDFLFFFTAAIVSGEGVFNYTVNAYDFIIDIVAMIVAIVTMFVGWFSFKKGNVAGSIVFYFLCAIAPVYIGYNLYLLFTEKQSLTRVFFFTTAAIAAIVRIFLIVYSCIVLKHFEKAAEYVNPDNKLFKEGELSVQAEQPEENDGIYSIEEVFKNTKRRGLQT